MRMTDERLAEIEAGWSEHKSILLGEYGCPEFNDVASKFETQFDELLQALKAEREAFAKYRHYHSQTELRERIEELEARLDATQSKYNELLMAVTDKHEGQTRHETALKYIQAVSNIGAAHEGQQAALEVSDE